MTKTVMQFASLLFVALAAGGAYVGSFTYYPADMSSSFYIEAMQHAIRRNGPPTSLVVNLGLAFTVVSAFVNKHDRPRFYLLLAACVCLITASTIMWFGNIPINREIETWIVNSPPSNWSQVGAQWWWLHIMQAGILVVGLSCLIFAALIHYDAAK